MFSKVGVFGCLAFQNRQNPAQSGFNIFDCGLTITKKKAVSSQKIFVCIAFIYVHLTQICFNYSLPFDTCILFWYQAYFRAPIRLSVYNNPMQSRSYDVNVTSKRGFFQVLRATNLFSSRPDARMKSKMSTISISCFK